MNAINKSVDTVTFTTVRRSYTRCSIEAVKLLHYQSLKDNSIRDDHLLLRNAPSYLDSAEVVVFYGRQDSQAEHGDITSTILRCTSPILPFSN